MGSVVGEKLWSLSTNHQVLVVTHLPQLAGYADKHYRVAKAVQANRTMTQVIPLDDDQGRITELSDMLGARGESGKQSAAEILQQARDFKRQVKIT